MPNRLASAARLSREEWRVCAQAWLLLLAVDLALRVLPFRRVEALLARAGTRRKRSNALTQARVHRLVAATAELHAWPILCLRRALVLQCLLNRSGVAATLQFGVRKAGEQLQAHAWLECDGEPVGEFEDELCEYKRLREPAGRRAMAPGADY